METPVVTYTVSQLNRRVRQLLETQFPLVWVEGEISNLARPASGHWYFTLKDDQAQVRCAMFRNRNSLTRFRPENGHQVLARCRLSLYEGRGDYQLIVEHLEEAGHGALQRQFEALKQRLSEEGLFDSDHKKALPTLPKRIGVVTSPSGAALHDILSVMSRRFPAIPVRIYPTTVQGDAAATAIVDAIALANEDNQCDALIVGRGGGSLEDLWPFNEEIVARAIFASQIPVVSAVGHEVDFSIADFVADYRAPTPSAAAEVLTPDGVKLLNSFVDRERLLKESTRRRLQSLEQRVDGLQRRLRHPGEQLKHQQHRLEALTQRLVKHMTLQLERQKTGLQHLNVRLLQRHPGATFKQLHQRHAQLSERLHRIMEKQLELKHQQWVNASNLLQAVSPLNTLDRGYAIVMDEQQNILRRASDTTQGSTITAKLSNGSLQCTVKKIIPQTS
ncbi:MAG: exodeoxyribonuclease VII large subunit [Gammaproteobacteria bacterium]|nr:MAG: exodeoxyribonuclease VII large subunit [Gammaproteobacteria bacterium]